MKILITSDWYAPAVNGVVASVSVLRRALTARGHEVRVLTLSRTPRSYEEDGVSYFGSLPAGLIYPGARLRAAPAQRLLDEVLRWGPDIVHSQCEFSTFPLARRVSAELGIPLVHTWHTVYENYTHYFSPSVQWGRRAVALFSRHIAARADALIAPTEKVASMLRGYRVAAPVYVVPSGIDLSRFQAPAAHPTALRERWGIPAGNKVLLSLGRLAAEKNLSELLEAMEACRRLPVTLLIAGGGPYRGELERQARRLGLAGRAIFTGMVPPEETADYYHMADLFVCASTSETQGLTYIEALASGLPVLCRADPCLAGVVRDGANGWQYESRDEFAAYVERFLADPGLAARMGAAARASAALFGADAFGGAVEAVYEALCRTSRLEVPA